MSVSWLAQAKVLLVLTIHCHGHWHWLQIGGPSWFLPLGRRDGNTSNAGETVFNLPPPFALYPQLVNMFLAKGLTEQDMVILSGKTFN